LLYDIQANDYLNEVMDRYASKPEVPLEDMEGIKALVRRLVEDALFVHLDFRKGYTDPSKTSNFNTIARMNANY